MDERSTDRLVKLLGMLGSDSAGERANAGAATDKLLRQHGLTWRQWIEQQDQKRDQRQQPRRQERSVAEIVVFCLGHPAALTGWETNFLQDIHRKIWRGLSEKQLATVRKILVKVEAYLDLTGK